MTTAQMPAVLAVGEHQVSIRTEPAQVRKIVRSVFATERSAGKGYRSSLVEHSTVGKDRPFYVMVMHHHTSVSVVSAAWQSAIREDYRAALLAVKAMEQPRARASTWRALWDSTTCTLLTRNLTNPQADELVSLGGNLLKPSLMSARLLSDLELGAAPHAAHASDVLVQFFSKHMLSDVRMRVAAFIDKVNVHAALPAPSSQADTGAALTGSELLAQTDNLAPADTALANYHVPRSVSEELERGTTQWRAEVGERISMWSGKQVAEQAQSAASNKAALASRWAAERKIFAVSKSGQALYPSFMFAHGQPLPALKGILAQLPAHWTGWDKLAFFDTPNAYLPGQARPMDVLRTNPDLVASVAAMTASSSDGF